MGRPSGIIGSALNRRKWCRFSPPLTEWAASGATAILEVPSVLVPRQKNYLINPAHALFGAIQVVEKAGFAFDTRLLSSIPPV